MKVKTSKEDQKFLDEICYSLNLEEDFKFKLKSEGIKLDVEIDLHRALLKDLISGVVNLDQAIKFILEKRNEKAVKKNYPLNL
jgi:hypothetical protein